MQASYLRSYFLGACLKTLRLNESVVFCMTNVKLLPLPSSIQVSNIGISYGPLKSDLPRAPKLLRPALTLGVGDN